VSGRRIWLGEPLPPCLFPPITAASESTFLARVGGSRTTQDPEQVVSPGRLLHRGGAEPVTAAGSCADDRVAEVTCVTCQACASQQNPAKPKNRTGPERDGSTQITLICPAQPYSVRRICRTSHSLGETGCGCRTFAPMGCCNSSTCKSPMGIGASRVPGNLERTPVPTRTTCHAAVGISFKLSLLRGFETRMDTWTWVFELAGKR